MTFLETLPLGLPARRPSSRPIPLPPVGRVLGGRYRLRRVIGRGGMGAVYEAEDLRRRERVAVKVLCHAPGAGRSAWRRFAREAEAMARIGHRGLVEVHDLGAEADGTAFMVMELLSGQSLAARLGRERRLGPSLSVHVARGTLAALHAAHAMGVLHRDVKPHNIFLLGSGPWPEVKVLDFGVAKLVGSDEGLTEAGMVVGTPSYMAPEQALGRADLDHRADLWAVGVVLYRCLTGIGPFDAATTAEVLVRVVTGTPPRPSTVWPSIPPDLEAVVMRALRKDQDDRYPSARAMDEALIAAL